MLFLISIPIDIWALGLVGRTVFLENLRLEPPASLGLSLWGRFAVAGALYLPLLWLIEGGVTDIARSTMQSILDMGPSSFPLPNESVWNSRHGEAVSLIVLLALIVHRIIAFLANWFKVSWQSAQPARDTYQGLISRWDMLRVPADQGLMLTAFTAAGAVLSILFWSVLPVSTPHPHECCKPRKSLLRPTSIRKSRLVRERNL